MATAMTATTTTTVATAPTPASTLHIPVKEGKEEKGDKKEEAIEKKDTAPPTTVTTTKPFRFFDLPAEIRLRIYEHHLTLPYTVDLDPHNYKLIIPRLNLFLASHRIHAEASRVFYASNTFRLLPLHGRFFHSPRPLLARLPPRYLKILTTLELRLGPGWTGLPRSWHISPESSLETRGAGGGSGRNALLRSLAQLESVRMLHVFIECDPASDETFAGFRKKGDEHYFTRTCTGLLACVLALAPAVQMVRFDAFPGIGRDSPLLRDLVGVVRGVGGGGVGGVGETGGTAGDAKRKVKVEWGPERGWTDDEAADKMREIEMKLKKLQLLRTGYSARVA